MRTYLVVWLALASCDDKPSPSTTAGARPGSGDQVGSAPRPAPAAAVAPPGPKLPAGIRALVATDPLPARGPDELVLLAATPGGTVILETHNGKRIEVPGGLVAKTTAPYELSGDLKYDRADVAEIVEAGELPHTAQVVTRAEESGGDFPQHEVWFVPTVGTRTRLVEDAWVVRVDWSDPQHRFAVVMVNEKAQLIDVKTGAATPIGDNVGSPSYAPDGTLYYRTLDGGAWRWTDHGAEKLGKGRHGKASTGNLNDGIEPARYPKPVKFGKTGKPSFR
jgi:hypothetical protein